jgi:hypothetical protein
MRKLLNQWTLNFVRRFHKKAELRLQEMKKQKMHGTPGYTKIAQQERRLRDLKKELQSRVSPPSPGTAPRRS